MGSKNHTMFNGAIAFNQDLGQWNVSCCKDFSSMFEGAVIFDQDIGNWTVSRSVSLSNMFKG